MSSGPRHAGAPRREPKADPGKRADGLIRAVESASEGELRAVADQALVHLDDADPWVRRRALDALGRLAEFRGVEFDGAVRTKVLGLAADADPHVRAEVAIAIALLRQERSSLRPEAWTDTRERSTLHKLLEDPSSVVRQEAAAALGDIGDASAADLLNARLADDDPQVVFEAAFALAVLGDPRGLETLTAALKTGRRRLDACEALRRLRHRDAILPLRNIAGRFFLSWPDRLTVWATLYAIGERDAAQSIIDRTTARNREERTYALALIGTHRVLEGASTLEHVARNANDPLRDTAVRGLGDLGEATHASTLVAVAEDPASPVELSLDAVTALGKLPRDARVPCLQKIAAGSGNRPDVRQAAREILAAK